MVGDTDAHMDIHMHLGKARVSQERLYAYGLPVHVWDSPYMILWANYLYWTEYVDSSNQINETKGMIDHGM